MSVIQHHISNERLIDSELTTPHSEDSYSDHPELDYIGYSMMEPLTALHRSRRLEQRAEFARPSLGIAARDSLDIYREPGIWPERKSRSGSLTGRIADLGRRARDSIVGLLSRKRSESTRGRRFSTGKASFTDGRQSPVWYTIY